MTDNRRTIVIGDIHGSYIAFINLLKAVKYQEKQDRLILLGDYIDRGKDAYSVIKKIQRLQKSNGKKNVIALRGNHEQMLIDNELYWKNNGKLATLLSYQKNNSTYYDDLKWFMNLPVYHETENFIFVHAGINPNKPLTEQKEHNMLWDRDNDYTNSKKTVIFGHTPTQLFGVKGDLPVKVGNAYGIDTACVYNGKLTALIIENDEVKEYYQVQGNVVYNDNVNAIEDAFPFVDVFANI